MLYASSKRTLLLFGAKLNVKYAKPVKFELIATPTIEPLGELFTRSTWNDVFTNDDRKTVPIGDVDAPVRNSKSRLSILLLTIDYAKPGSAVFLLLVVWAI